MIDCQIKLIRRNTRSRLRLTVPIPDICARDKQTFIGIVEDIRDKYYPNWEIKTAEYFSGNK